MRKTSPLDDNLLKTFPPERTKWRSLRALSAHFASAFQAIRVRGYGRQDILFRLAELKRIDAHLLGMRFWIELLKGRDIIESEHFAGDSALARERAAVLFAIYSRRLGATSVRLIDPTGGKIALSITNDPKSFENVAST